ncbi:MAG: tetratricopeptide repeat protein [Acidobacteriota bacterium]|jgi:tetratricopeptide (TPR) repeat protein
MRTTITALVLTVLALVVAVPADAGWEEGVEAFKAGNYSVAAKEFQSVVESSPEYANGHFMLGQALSKLNRKQEALNGFRKAYDLNPNSVQFQFALANAYLAVERYGDAARLYQMIDASGLPRNMQPAFHKNKALALGKSGRSDEALAALRDTARSSPNDAEAQYHYGIAAFNSGDTDAGAAALERAVRLDAKETYREAYIKALIRQAREGRGNKVSAYAKAVEQARALVSSSPTYDNLLTLGEAQLGAKQYQAAAQTFGRAADQKSGDWLPHFYRSQALTSLQQYGEAEESLRQALAADPSSSDERRVYRQIGFVNEKLKNYEEAKTAYSRAGDSASVERVQQNQEIAEENRRIEAENRRIEEMRREREKLEQELKELEEGGPPPAF